MLTTQTLTVDDARAELTEGIEALEDALDGLDEDTDDAAVIRDRKSTLTYWRNGLDWQTSEGDWTTDTELTVGAMNAGEEAMMHREVPEQAGQDEFRIWFVAASVEAGPFVEDDLNETFANAACLHPAVVKWLEAKANGLGTASDEGNGSSKSSSATDSEATSAQPPDSTT
ncbi:hypothetical protein [Halorubrum lacusprofundi]|uniref:Uncharacterized protein n=1 Tax=Halorubrum lacusprofundi (strain ATCC 49239 / DSM 5036 / JCM 8891 / ACAM 34) TaxID=416348 RepID=B9LUL1_HALLT|nr:hypothetical protein [Halorubrum lacusprofundi]ACM56368.1 hypothetical protein Hlac_0768 [Halorubrum lacusprofundi ATCC 49239]